MVPDYGDHAIKLEPTEMTMMTGGAVGPEVGSEEVIEEAVMEMPLNDDEDQNVIYYHPVTHHSLQGNVGSAGIVLQGEMVADDIVEEVVGRGGQGHDVSFR